MIEQLPLYVSIVFILTTLLTVWLLLRAIPRTISDKLPSRLLIFLLPFWLILQGVLGIGDFYHFTNTFPPRAFLFGVLPALLLIVVYFLFFRKSFVDDLSLKALTLVSVVRVLVELVLLCLYEAGQVPRLMTFEGYNLDVLSGLTAPLIYFLGFRNGKTNRSLLIGWNLVSLGLLSNIVVIAFLSFQSPLQKLAFDQPNVAVTYFPFIWLPSVIVPIILFTHLASFWKLTRKETPTRPQ